MSGVSVVMTTYNEEEFIADAIDSILEQTCQEFEIVIVDDGSRDATCDIVADYENEDDRIRLLEREHMGRSAALNCAIDAARYGYFAVVDPDDLSLPHRLETQRAYLDAHPEVAIVGSAYEAINEIRDESYTRYYPTSDEEIRRAMAKFVPIPHSSMMARKAAVVAAEGYDESREVIVDLDLYIRVARTHELANIDEPLIRRHIHTTSNFHALFSDKERQLSLVRLNLKAVRELSLPPHYYLYPPAHLLYWQLPDGVKRSVRRLFSSLSEESTNA